MIVVVTEDCMFGPRRAVFLVWAGLFYSVGIWGSSLNAFVFLLHVPRDLELMLFLYMRLTCLGKILVPVLQEMVLLVMHCKEVTI